MVDPYRIETVEQLRVEEFLFHCGKVFIRSSSWKPETSRPGAKANIGAQIAKRANADEHLAEAIEKNLAKDYRDSLY